MVDLEAPPRGAFGKNSINWQRDEDSRTVVLLQLLLDQLTEVLDEDVLVVAGGMLDDAVDVPLAGIELLEGAPDVVGLRNLDEERGEVLDHRLDVPAPAQDDARLAERG